MLDPNKLKADILEDMRVELSDEFDRNFERKTFFVVLFHKFLVIAKNT